MVVVVVGRRSWELLECLEGCERVGCRMRIGNGGRDDGIYTRFLVHLAHLAPLIPGKMTEDSASATVRRLD